MMTITTSYPLIGDTFTVSPLAETLQTQMFETGVWKTGCPVDIERLRLVKFFHVDFSGQEKEGQIVVLEAVADKVAMIFQALYTYKFPIAQARPMNEYFGNDTVSMKANNNSAFNFRPIAGKTLLSVHSYGVAIDINPIQNPYLMTPDPKDILDTEEIAITVQPAKGAGYMNRTNVRAGMVEQILDHETGMRVVDLFKQYGFDVWGGNWNFPVDYQHFQPSRAAAEWLAFMSPEDATTLFDLYIQTPDLLKHPEVRSSNYDFKTLYTENPVKFMQTLKEQNFLKLTPQEAYEALSS
jgi:hypothetical protein